MHLFNIALALLSSTAVLAQPTPAGTNADLLHARTEVSRHGLKERFGPDGVASSSSTLSSWKPVARTRQTSRQQILERKAKRDLRARQGKRRQEASPGFKAPTEENAAETQPQCTDRWSAFSNTYWDTVDDITSIKRYRSAAGTNFKQEDCTLLCDQTEGCNYAYTAFTLCDLTIQKGAMTLMEQENFNSILPGTCSDNTSKYSISWTPSCIDMCIQGGTVTVTGRS